MLCACRDELSCRFFTAGYDVWWIPLQCFDPAEDTAILASYGGEGLRFTVPAFAV